jgi:hypothetical protein
MKTIPLQAGLAAATMALTLALGACGVDATGEAPDSTDPHISPDFSFKATRDVKIQVSSQKGDSLPFTVKRETGEVVLQGALAAGKPFQAGFPLQLQEHEVIVQLGAVERHIPVGNDGLVAAVFE